MEAKEFFREVGELIGRDAHAAMLSLVDQQGARNKPFIDGFRPLVGDEITETINGMLDTVFVAGFTKGITHGKGEKNEG